MKTLGLLRSLIIACLLLLQTSLTIAQTGIPIWKFARTATNGDITLMQSDTLGNTYLAGTFNSANFLYGNDSVPGITGAQTLNAFVLKIDPTGRLIWLYSGHGLEIDSKIRPVKMSISNRGELAIALSAENTSAVSFDDLMLTTDTSHVIPFIIKISKTGNINWAYSLKAMNTIPEIKVNDLFIDELGDVYTTGYFRGDSALLQDRIIAGFHSNDMLFIAKIESRGNIAWFRNCPNNSEMDNADIRGTIIKNSPSGFFYLGGIHAGYRSFYFNTDSICNSLETDCFLAQYSKSNGMAQWGRVFRGDSLDYIDDIVVTDNNNVVALAIYSSNIMSVSGNNLFSINGAFNLALAEFTEAGTYVISDYYTTQLPYYDPTRKTSYLGKDSDGNLILCSEFNGATVFNGGFTLTNNLAGTSDILMASLTGNSLTPNWTAQGKAPGDNFIEGAGIDNSGNIYLAGTSYNSLTIGAETVVGNAVEGTPYLAKIKNNGSPEYIYWQDNTANGQISLMKIAGDNYGNSYVAGNYQGPLSAIDEIDLTTTTTTGMFLGKYAFTKNLNGTVQNEEGDIINNGYVKIFGYSLYQRSPLNDSVFINPDGSFEFFDIPAGTYLIVACPVGDEAEVYIPTYYPSVEYWEFAEHIRITPDSDPGSFVIILQRADEFIGVTELDGNVSEDNEGKSLKYISPDKGRPTKKATVVLAGNKKEEKSTYQVVATAETDDEGNFAFYGIENGSYYLWVDIPGLPCEPVYFIEINGNQFVSSLDYLVNEEVVSAEGFPIYSAIDSPSDNSGILLFPNPAYNVITLILPSHEEAFADIFDSHGSRILRFNLKQSENRLDVSELVPGNYTLRLYSNNTLVFKKLTILP